MVLYLAPRKHLYATNLIIFVIIYIMRKCLQLFCIIERKTCNNDGCGQDTPCQEKDCKMTDETSAQKQTDPAPKYGFGLVLNAMRQTMHGFGYGEGHFQIFVEKKERYQPTESRLNAARAEVNLNPN